MSKDAFGYDPSAAFDRERCIGHRVVISKDGHKQIWNERERLERTQELLKAVEAKKQIWLSEQGTELAPWL